MRDSTLVFMATALAALFAILTTLSALGHMISNKKYGWLVLTIFFVFVSAYLYGLIEVTGRK